MRPIALVLACLITAASATAHAVESRREHAIKAAFLYHFGQFVEWPSSEGEFVIGILGPDVFEEEIDALELESLRGRPIRVRRLKNASEAAGCHIVYVAPSKDEAAVFRELKGMPVLTVGESAGFLEKGGIICFVRTGNKLRFAINKSRADESGLKLSSQLLSLATQVIA